MVVVRDLRGFEAVDIEDVVVLVAVESDDDDRRIVRLFTCGVGEVNCGEDIDSSVFEEPLAVFPIDEGGVIVLESVSFDWGGVDCRVDCYSIAPGSVFD